LTREEHLKATDIFALPLDTQPFYHQAQLRSLSFLEAAGLLHPTENAYVTPFSSASAFAGEQKP
jgi:hypothetical protein